MSSVATWKRCLRFHPGDRLAMAGLATTLWGIVRDNAGNNDEWRDVLLLESKLLFEGSVDDVLEEVVEESDHNNNEVKAFKPYLCEGPVPAEAHSLYAAFIQDELNDSESARKQLSKACKKYMMLSEARDGEMASKNGGFMTGGSADVPATVLYRLGRCAENASDLAAAESFLTWSLEVNLGCANAIANVQHVMKWVYGTEGGGGAGLRSQVVDAAIETLEFCKAETRVSRAGRGGDCQSLDISRGERVGRPDGV